MGKYLFYNGRFLKNDTPLFEASSRGLRYGDGLFETMKWEKGAIRFKEYHFERLFGGLALLQFEPPSYFTTGWLDQYVDALCKKNQQTTARVRLAVFRGNGGLYDPENHFPNCLIQSWPLAVANLPLNENGLVTGIYDRARKSQDAFANLKHNNYLPYAMAALYAKQQHWNDAILLNSSGHICDATIANIFMMKEGVVYTPSLQQGCVAGVMRRFLLTQLPANGYPVIEKELTTAELYRADEVFLTNVTYGIRWVQSCDHRQYTNSNTTDIVNKLFKNAS
jgi:aminodeoxychorismate lyase